MLLVIDTSIAVAALLRSGGTRTLIFSENFTLFSPDWIKDEIMSHKQEFKEKGNMDEEEFIGALELLLENINTYPEEEYLRLKQTAPASKGFSLENTKTPTRNSLKFT